MQRGLRVTLALCALGCNRDKDEPAGDSSPPEAPPCDVVTLDQSWPEDGLSPASRDIRLSVGFTGAVSDEGLSFSVIGPDGATVAGSVTRDEADPETGMSGATWAPDALLEADQAYTWTVSVCEAQGGGAFTTGAHGERVDAAGLIHTSFELDLTHATWIQPEGGASIFRSLFDGVLLLGVESADDVSIDLIAGVGEQIDSETVQQDPCFETADFEAESFRNNPYARVGPTTLTLDVQGFAVPLQGVTVSGAFTDGGAALSDGTLDAELDVRDVAGSLGASADEVCDLLSTIVGLDCAVCSVDAETYCVTMQLTDVDGEEIPGLRVVPNENPAECDTGGGAFY